MNDPDNAYLAFEKAAMLPEAIKNPLIYLNFAIHCHETGRIEQSQLNFSNFEKMTEQMKVRVEVKFLDCRYMRNWRKYEKLFYLKIARAFEKLSIELSKYDDVENAHESTEDDSAKDLENDEDPHDDENIQENLV